MIFRHFHKRETAPLRKKLRSGAENTENPRFSPVKPYTCNKVFRCSDHDLHFVHGVGPVHQVVLEFQSKNRIPVRQTGEISPEAVRVPAFLQDGRTEADKITLRNHLNIPADMIRAGFCENKIAAWPASLGNSFKKRSIFIPLL